jgi:hypothetical protein
MDYSDQVNEAAKKAAISGGITGGLVGGVTPLLSMRKKNWRRYLLESLGAGALGAATAGGLAGGATMLGSKMLGAPEPDDPSAYTRRATLGGVVGGGALGAGLGAGAAAVGKLPKQSPHLARSAIELLKKSPRGKMIGALIGAGTLGGTAGFLGADEGMQVDFINNELRRQKRLEALSGLL